MEEVNYNEIKSLQNRMDKLERQVGEIYKVVYNLDSKVQRDGEDNWEMVADLRAKLKDLEKKQEGEKQHDNRTQLMRDT